MGKKRKVLRDKRGEFCWEYYLIGGKQKKRKRRLIAGFDEDDFIQNHADDLWLHQNGYFHVLHQIEERRKESTNQDGIANSPF